MNNSNIESITYTPATCPVLQDARRALNASRDMAQAMERLRRSRRRCRTCPVGG